MDKPVLVDSSVWIAYLRKEETAFSEINMLADSGRIHLSGVVLAELLQRCKSSKEVAVVHDLADVFPKLDEAPDTWERVGLLANKLRKKGKNIGLADCYIALMATGSGCLLYTYDKHFVEIAPLCNLELYRRG